MKIERGLIGMMNKTRLDYAASLWVFYFFRVVLELFVRFQHRFISTAMSKTVHSLCCFALCQAYLSRQGT